LKVHNNVRNRDKAINSFLFADRQTDREDKLRVGAVLKNIHWSQTRKLVEIVSNYIETKYI